MLLLVALLAVLPLPASLLLPTSVADLFALAGAGFLVIVGRTAGGFAVSSVFANEGISSGSVRLCGCWHSYYCFGRTAGGFAVAGVSAIACVCGGSVRPCWHAGILVIVGCTAGGVAVAGVSSIACCLCMLRLLSLFMMASVVLPCSINVFSVGMQQVSCCILPI
jgi:hypothetical protein